MPKTLRRGISKTNIIKLFPLFTLLTTNSAIAISIRLQESLARESKSFIVARKNEKILKKHLTLKIKFLKLAQLQFPLHFYSINLNLAF